MSWYEFNIIHINHNLTCPPHTDDKNIGKSILVSIGEYTGSQLVVDGTPYTTYCRPIRFNGNTLLHSNTNDLVGNKYSIVYYTKKLRPNKVVDGDGPEDLSDDDSIVEELNDLNLEDDFEDNNSCLFDED